ncbi:MAG: NADH:ubiquinone reductase (Na(+)-transporting) subunit A [Myxococcota bacterium]
MVRIRRGLDLPIPGAADGAVQAAPTIRRAGVLGADYPGLHLRSLVAVGDAVALGQPILVDRRDPSLRVTAPGSGHVSAIHPGERRTIEAVEIGLGAGEERRWEPHDPETLARQPRSAVVSRLCESGLWCALRARPFGKIPSPATEPDAIFVTALDTHPLAPPPELAVGEHAENFVHGLTVLTVLTPGAVHLCRGRGSPISARGQPRVREVEFSGPHPAGLAGTHVHHLMRIRAGRSVWTLGYADVIAIGKLFTTGRLWTERIVSVAGPGVRQPRHLRARLGASTEDLVGDLLGEGPCRIVSGSLLAGHTAAGRAAFVGRGHVQVSVLPEPSDDERASWWGVGRHGRARRLLPWRPRTFAGRGEDAAPGPFLPLPEFERVVPLDLPVLPLLRALVVGDDETAAALGALELTEEDLALCSFLCPSRIDYGARLRRVLERLEAQL